MGVLCIIVIHSIRLSVLFFPVFLVSRKQTRTTLSVVKAGGRLIGGETKIEWEQVRVKQQQQSILPVSCVRPE